MNTEKTPEIKLMQLKIDLLEDINSSVRYLENDFLGNAKKAYSLFNSNRNVNNDTGAQTITFSKEDFAIFWDFLNKCVNEDYSLGQDSYKNSLINKLEAKKEILKKL
jgi:hypothetical protein